MYAVIKHIDSHPGPGGTTVTPERTVEMSRHRTKIAAEKAAYRYDRDHQGYAEFEIVRAGEEQ